MPRRLTASLVAALAAAACRGGASEEGGFGEGEGESEHEAARGEGEAEAEGESEAEAEAEEGEAESERAIPEGDLSCTTDWREGWQEIEVRGTLRNFHLGVPDGPGPHPVVFVFHGQGSSAYGIRGWFLDAIRGNGTGEPFVEIVPDTIWDMDAGEYAWDFDANGPDLAFFDELRACALTGMGGDPDRVSAAGFSMGGHWVDFLATVRGDALASIGQVSGGFFWDYRDTFAARPAVLAAWGGAGDRNQIFDFAAAARESIDLFRAAGHFVLACDHGRGHRFPYDFDIPVIRFLLDHPRTTTADSPYLDAGLPPAFDGWGCRIETP